MAQNEERPASPEEEVVLSKAQEYLGPSDEADAEFAKELAKMVTDTSVESRKVDKKTALALWDSAVLPAMRKRRDESDDTSDADKVDTMKFTLLSRRGNKQQVPSIWTPGHRLTNSFHRPANWPFRQHLLLRYTHVLPSSKTKLNNSISNVWSWTMNSAKKQRN